MTRTQRVIEEDARNKYLLLKPDAHASFRNLLVHLLNSYLIWTKEIKIYIVK